MYRIIIVLSAYKTYPLRVLESEAYNNVFTFIIIIIIIIIHENFLQYPEIRYNLFMYGQNRVILSQNLLFSDLKKWVAF